MPNYCDNLLVVVGASPAVVVEPHVRRRVDGRAGWRRRRGLAGEAHRTPCDQFRVSFTRAC